VVVRNYEPVTLTEYDIEDMIEADRKKIEEQFGDYGFEEWLRVSNLMRKATGLFNCNRR